MSVRQLVECERSEGQERLCCDEVRIKANDRNRAACSSQLFNALLHFRNPLLRAITRDSMHKTGQVKNAANSCQQARKHRMHSTMKQDPLKNSFKLHADDWALSHIWLGDLPSQAKPSQAPISLL